MILGKFTGMNAQLNSPYVFTSPEVGLIALLFSTCKRLW